MKPSERLQSLDALRGFDMLFIMGFASLVVAVCGLWPNAVTDSIASQMGHASWDGFTHHDTIFPLFLFIAGVSFPFSLSKQRSLGLSTGTIYAKIVRRALTLVLLGVIYNGLFRLDFENLRIASVLGRIGLAWGIAAVLYLNFGVKARIAIAAAILVGYGLLSALVAAPDVAGAGPLTREGCLAGYVDRLLLPGKLYGKTFDPEGLLSTVPAVVTAMLGMFTGEFVRRQDLSGGRKASWMIAAARIAIAAAILVGYGLLSALVAAPDVAGAGPLTREGCLAGYVDRLLLPGKLYGKTFDPEGLLSTVPAVVTAMLGMFTGEFVRRQDLSGGRKASWMIAAAVALLVAGLAFNGVVPVNKSLWSSTFVCVVAAYSLAMFALFYYLIDVRGWRRWTLFFRVVGLNSITIYLAQRIVGFGRISDFFLGGVASKCPEALAAVVNSAGYVAVCWLFLYFLYRKNVFLKV